MNHFENEMTIDQIVESFSARLERGERPSIEEYKEKYPELADRIDAVLPALVMLENVDTHASRADSNERKLAVDDSIPEILGDYQIVQEIGRGGMGIVFEAMHTRMRRRVALKVLPKSVSNKQGYVNRFLTEATSAGQLHHTNIVPVFEVGEAEGLHFYAMQFIHGENLDRVINDVKRLRENSGRITNRKKAEPGTSVNWEPTERLSSVIAGELTSTDKTVVGSDASLENHVPQVHQDHSEPSSGGLSDSVFGSTNTTIGRSKRLYHQRVAAVGVQVAGALEYAHNHGVLHRDIKPANLILDTEGTVWVADFGLAKTDASDLTKTGDFIGTLGYMAPERFDGEADRRSDVYSLGLTLYELCTLRTAIDATDRVKLITDASNRSILPPRKVDETIPRDLETIILKAIEGQPGRRYQSAAEFGEDLELFLSDRPIRARRASAIEKGWRICRRNPVLTTLFSCVAALLLILLFGSLQYAWNSDQRFAAEAKAKEVQIKATQAATTARKEAQQALYASLLDQAEMRRLSRRLGQRFDSLHAIQRANFLLPKLELSEEKVAQARSELRKEAIAAMALTDVRTAEFLDVQGHQGLNMSVAFDARYEHYALGDFDGGISVYQMQDDTDDVKIASLPGQGQPCWTIKFSTNGRYLAANYHDSNALYRDVSVLLWDLQNPAEPTYSQTGVVSFDFAIDSNSLAFAVDDEVEIVSTATGDVTATFEPSFPPRLVQLSHDGNRAAVSKRGGTELEIWNVKDEPDLEVSQQAGNNITAMDWRSDRAILAVGTRYGEVFFWNGSYQADPTRIEAHQNEVKHLHIHPVDDLIASDSTDMTVAFTNLSDQKKLIDIEDKISLLNTGFSDSGRLCHFHHQKRGFGVWETAAPLLSVASNSDGFGRRVRFCPTKPEVVAMLTNKSIVFWDVVEPRQMQRLDLPQIEDCCFSPDGAFFYTSGENGVHRRPVTFSSNSDGSVEIKLGEATQLIESTRKTKMTINRTGEFLVSTTKQSAQLLDSASGTVLQQFGRHSGLNRLQLTADERYLLTGTERGRGVCIWDINTGKLFKRIMPNHMTVTVTTHPSDPTRFFTSDHMFLYLWKFDGKDQPELVEKFENLSGPSCYSNDGKWLAIQVAPSKLALLDANSLKVFAAFEASESDRIIQFSFSPDDSRLATACFKSMQVWNLDDLKSSLEEMDLGW